MLRGGFVKFNGDKNATGMQGIKAKNVLRVNSKNSSSHPLLAFEDSNGVSPAHSPTRWELMQGVEEEEEENEEPVLLYECPPILIPKQDEKSLSSAKPLMPIPTPKQDQTTKVSRRKQASTSQSTDKPKWTSFSDGVAGRPIIITEDDYTADKQRLQMKTKDKPSSSSSKLESKYPMDNQSVGSGSSGETSDPRAITQMVSSGSSDESSCRPVDERFADKKSKITKSPLVIKKVDTGKIYNCPISSESSQSGKTENTTISGTSTSSSSSSKKSMGEDIDDSSADGNDPDTRRDERKLFLLQRRETMKKSKPRKATIEAVSEPKSETTEGDDAQSLSSDIAVKPRRNYPAPVKQKKREPENVAVSTQTKEDAYNTGPERRPLAKDDFSYDGSAECKAPSKMFMAMKEANTPATRKQRTLLQTSDPAARPAKLRTKADEPEKRKEESLHTFDDAKIWKEVLSPSGDANGWTTPRELLSPAYFTKTPMNVPPQREKFQSSSASVADLLAVAESAIEGPSKPKENQDEFLKKFLEMAMPMIKSGVVSDDQQEEIRQAAEKLGISLSEDNSADESEQKTANLQEVPSDVKVVHRRHTFHDVKNKIGKRESIHFQKVRRRRRGASPSSNSLLDSVADSESRIETKDDGTAHDSEIQSTSSETVSTLSYHTRRKGESKSKDGKSKRSTRHESSSPVADSKADVENRPLGSTTQEIKMLNKFLKIAGPSLSGPSLSAEDRERLHDDALKAGLPEDFINKMLDQSAGIQRWEESSYRSRQTKARTASPGGSVNTKSTDCSDMSHSTKYTRDTESISCYTYDEDGLARKSPRTEVAGGYGCVDKFQSYFWAESGSVGQDMLDNVAAVISGDMDDVAVDDDLSRRPKRWLT